MKNRIVISLLTILTMLTLGCSSSTESTNYYLLTNKIPSLQTVEPLSNSKKNQYQLTVKLPDYLQKPYLVMQLDEHKIHYSLFHLWAEPLNKGFGKALLFDLNNEQSSNYFVSSENDSQLMAAKILITLDYFHITERASVILAGQFSVQKGTNKSYQRFTFEQTLAADGYTHAISQMRLLITQLSKQIIMSI